MIQEGQKAPAFALPSSEGKTVRLAQLRGQKLVLYFYPKDDTPGCTRQACAFRDVHAEIRRAGAVVYGVSPDPLASHESFRARHKPPFALLADTDKAVAKKYGAYGEKLMYGRKVVGMIRSTFLIDAKGVVRRVFARVRVDGHAEAVLAALEGLG